MYNVISLELILHMYSQVGGIEGGYDEWICEDYVESDVHVKSPEGMIHTTFSYGLRQGKGFSCPLALLVALALIQVWSKPVPDPDGVIRDTSLHPYIFEAKDEDDETAPHQLGESYVDDASRYTTADDGPTLLHRAQTYVNHAGDFSLVTKIGRKARKCMVRLFGLTFEEQQNIPPITSIAWSYMHDRPIHCTLNKTIQTTHLLDEPEEEEYEIEFNSKDATPSQPDEYRFDRHFGTYVNMQATTDSHSTIPRMRERLANIHKPHTNKRLIQLAHNTLVTSLGEFNPLLHSHTAANASESIDGDICRNRYANFGLTINDPKQPIFLPTEYQGHGLRHAGMAELSGKGRELEIQPNANKELGRKLRSRLAALKDDPTAKNFLKRNITELATYGYFLRDLRNPFHTTVMDRLLMTDEDYRPPLGEKDHFRKGEIPARTDATLGKGHQELAKMYSLGSPLCTFLRQYTSPSGPPQNTDPYSPDYWNKHRSNHYLPDMISPERLAKAFIDASEATAQRFRDANTIYEWRCGDNNTDPTLSPTNHWTDRTPTLPTRWTQAAPTTYITNTKKESKLKFHPRPASEYCPLHQTDTIKITKLQEITEAEAVDKNIAYNNTCRELEDWCLQFSRAGERGFGYQRAPTNIHEQHTKFKESLRLDPTSPTDQTILTELRRYNSPPILSTDAGQKTINGASVVVATATLCAIDFTTADITDTKSWEDNRVIPLRCLVQIVPCQTGNIESSNNTGELCAALLADAMIPPTMAAITFLDSQAVRKPLINLRDHARTISDRQRIRQIFPSLGKAQMSIADTIMRRIATTDFPNSQFPDEAATTTAFIEAVKQPWLNKDKYKEEQFDPHPHRPLIHVKSHQANAAGTLKTTNDKQNPAYPCYAAVHANHLADVPCSNAIKQLTRKLGDDAIDAIGPIPRWRLELAYRDYSSSPPEKWKLIKEEATTAPFGTVNWPDNPTAQIIDKRPYNPIPHQHLPFGFTRMGRIIDRSITVQIKTDITKELLHRLGIRNKKGWLGRNFHAVDNVRRGPNNILWCINTHNAAYHTRQLQISDKYRKAIFALRKPDEDMPKSIDTNDAALKQCPLCADQPNLSSTPAGTARHIHCLCTNKELSTARNLSYNAIEHTLRKYRLLRIHSPTKVPLEFDIPTQIGLTLKRLDSIPRYTKKGPEPRRAIVTSQTELRQVINIAAISDGAIPLHHPYHHVLTNCPLVCLAGLLQITPHDLDGISESVTDNMFRGYVPIQLDPAINTATKTLTNQMRSGGLTTTEITAHFHRLCDTNKDIAAIFPIVRPEDEEEDDTDDDERGSERENTTNQTTRKPSKKPKLPPRRTLREAFEAIQAELFDDLSLRTIAMHRLGVSLIKGFEYELCAQPPDAKEAKSKPRGLVQQLMPGAEPPKEDPQQPKPRTTNPPTKFQCKHPRCQIAQMTLSHQAGEAPTPAGSCLPCRQLARAQKLNAKLERTVANTPSLQQLLASQQTWTKDELKNTLLANPTTERIIEEDLRKTPDDQSTSRHIGDAAQLLANTILARPLAEHRLYDPRPTATTIDTLNATLHQHRCGCNPATHPIAREITPQICPSCNLLRQHPRTTADTCFGCAKPTKLKNILCTQCKIGALCHFHSSQTRWKALTNKLDNPSRLTQAITPQQAQQPTKPIERAEALFPINTILEQRILTVRHKITRENKTEEFSYHYTKIYKEPPHNLTNILSTQLQCIRRLDPAVSVAQYLDEEAIINFFRITHSISPRKHEIGLITPYDTRKMDDRTITCNPIRRQRHQTRPWKAAKDHVTILMPFQKCRHWTLAVLHKPKGLGHYDSAGDTGNRLFLERAIHATIPSIKRTTTLRKENGPTQPNGYTCADCVCLVLYAWLLHPKPWTIDWEKLTSVPKFFPRFRRFIRYAICTGKIYNIFHHFDIPTKSKEQQPISTFLTAKAATIATTGRAQREPLPTDGLSHGTDEDVIILEDTPDDTANTDPDIPDTITIPDTATTSARTEIPNVAITAAALNGILDSQNRTNPDTTMESAFSAMSLSPKDDTKPDNLDTTMNSALSAMSITNTDEDEIPPEQINIGEAIGPSPLTDPTSEFSQQSESKSTTSSTAQSRSTTTASSTASTKAKRRRYRRQIKKSKKPKHAKPTARR